MKKTLLSLVLVGIVGIQAGCVLDPIEQHHTPNPQLVLTAFLRPGAAIDSVLLTRTVPPDQYYVWMYTKPVFDQYKVSGANAVITHAGKTYPLSPRGSGLYGDPNLIVQAGETYDIDVTFPQGHEFADRHLTASTTVPSQMRLDPPELDPSQIARGVLSVEELLFPKQLAAPDKFGKSGEVNPFRLSWDRVANAAGYAIEMSADDTTGTELLRKRAYEDWKDDDYANPNARQFLAHTLYMPLPDSIQIEVFWLGFNYRGWQDVVVFACDAGLYDYWRTLFGPGGGGGDADIGIIWNVKGGMGVFGSFSSDTVRTFIKAEWLPSQSLPPKGQ